MTDAFLPKDEKEPIQSNYMKFEQGENTFRVLSSSIVGTEYWKSEITNDGKEIRRPVRLKSGEPAPLDELEKDKEGNLIMPKYFWAFVVYNRNQKRIQVLEITQATIRKAIRALTLNAKWGDPKQYDISVTKEGEKFDTEYQVTPNPKEELEKDIADQYKKTKINLEALFEGKDPFEAMSKDKKEQKKEEVISDEEIDEIDKALGMK